MGFERGSTNVTKDIGAETEKKNLIRLDPSYLIKNTEQYYASTTPSCRKDAGGNAKNGPILHRSITLLQCIMYRRTWLDRDHKILQTGRLLRLHRGTSLRGLIMVKNGASDAELH